MQVKALSREGRESIIYERSKNGPFTNVEDFLLRVGCHLHLQDVRLLIKAGCFDSIAHGLTRPSLMWQALRFYGRDYLKENRPPLFPVPSFQFPRKQPPYSKHLTLRHELDTLGLFISRHPLERYGRIVKNIEYVKACNLNDHVGKTVTTIGWLVTGKTVHTKNGELMKFVSFEDTTGLYETVFFPQVYHQFCHMLNEMRPYILKGKVEEDFGFVSLTVNRIGFLERYKGGVFHTRPDL
jgi:error-prone DNA polymerase